MKTVDRFCGELVMLFDRFLDAKDEDAGQARDAIHAAIKQDRAEALLAGEPERVDAGFDPQVHLLREFSVWLDEQSECHSDGELCFVCDQARCAPTCLRVRTLTLLAVAPSPEPQPTAKVVAEAVLVGCVEFLRERAKGCDCGEVHEAPDASGLADDLEAMPLAPILKTLGATT